MGHVLTYFFTLPTGFEPVTYRLTACRSTN